MSIKLEIIGKSLVITDSATPNKTQAETPASLVYYDVHELENNQNVRIQNIDQDLGNVVHRRFSDYPLSNCVDSGDVAFTEATFKAFARASFGPS